MTVTLNHPDGETLLMHQRDDWGARPRRNSPTWSPSTPRRNLFLHHTAGQSSQTIERTNLLVRSVQNFHQNNNGWSDIAYNFLVDDIGTLVEGRGFFFQNGANTPANSSSYSVCYLGHSDGPGAFPTAARETINWLLGYLNAPISACPGGCGFKGHRDVSATICPGNRAYEWLQDGRPINECGH